MPKAVPVDYQSTIKKPDDFDAFWDGVQQQAAAIPLEPEIIPDPLRTSEEIEVFQVFYTSLEHVRIAAWYCRPTRRAERIPAVLLLPGYQADPPIPKEWAYKGYCALSVAPRGKLRSNRQFNPGWHVALDLHCLLTVSEAITRAALERRESRGAHTRVEYPDSDKHFGTVNVIVRRQNGAMTVTQEPLPELPAELRRIVEGEV